MSHVPIETAEEDAADLQFPKGKRFNTCTYASKNISLTFIRFIL